MKRKGLLIFVILGLLLTMTHLFSNQNVYVFLGPPGAGKGTQCKKLSEELNLPHISTGDLFRAQAKKDTPLAKELKSYMSKGELVPDEIVAKMLLERVSESDCKNGYLLDGFPRTENQAKVLEKYINKENMTIVNVSCEDEVILSRLTGRRTCPNCTQMYHIESLKPKVDGKCDKCNHDLITRSDDREEVIKNRLLVYSKDTAPLLEYYSHGYTIIDVNGKQDIEQGFSALLEKVTQKEPALN